jgi:uncharacterized protein YcfL
MRKMLIATSLALLLLTGCQSTGGTNGKAAAQLNGHAEDAMLVMDASAQRQSDGNYKGKVTIKNKAQHSVSLLYNCGGQLWWQGLKSPKPSTDGSVNVCPGIYASELAAGQTTEITLALTSGTVADWNALAVSVRYELPQGSTPSQTTVTTNLRPNN